MSVLVTLVKMEENVLMVPTATTASVHQAPLESTVKQVSINGYIVHQAPLASTVRHININDYIVHQVPLAPTIRGQY